MAGIGGGGRKSVAGGNLRAASGLERGSSRDVIPQIRANVPDCVSVVATKPGRHWATVIWLAQIAVEHGWDW
ncbi:MAG: hypothetical protein IPK19_42010 [Chloroflexi bacterium]|nr:hypothetical protein [Chloroflexota bacterium]